MSIDITNFYKQHSIVTLRFILLHYTTLHFAVFILKGWESSESCPGVWNCGKSIRGCWIQMKPILQNITYAFWASTESNGWNCLLMYQIDGSMFADDNCKLFCAMVFSRIFPDSWEINSVWPYLYRSANRFRFDFGLYLLISLSWTINDFYRSTSISAKK